MLIGKALQRRSRDLDRSSQDLTSRVVSAGKAAMKGGDAGGVIGQRQFSTPLGGLEDPAHSSCSPPQLNRRQLPMQLVQVAKRHAAVASAPGKVCTGGVELGPVQTGAVNIQGQQRGLIVAPEQVAGATAVSAAPVSHVGTQATRDVVSIDT